MTYNVKKHKMMWENTKWCEKTQNDVRKHKMMWENTLRKTSVLIWYLC